MIKKSSLSLIFLILVTTLLAACSPQQYQQPRDIKGYDDDSFAVSEELIRQFETEQNATVTFIRGGDTGTVLNQAVLQGKSPGRCVLRTGQHLLTRALNEGLFTPYQSPCLQTFR